MTSYQSRDVSVQGAQFSGQNIVALEKMIGPDRVQACSDGLVQVRVSNGAWFSVHPGYWVVRWPDDGVSVCSGDFFLRFFIGP